MKRFVVILAALALAGGGVLTAQDAKMVEAGKRLFSSKECTKCHMIAGKGNKIGKLDGVASKISPDDMRKWLTNPAQMEAKLDHKPKVKMSSKMSQMKLKASEIDELIAYMQTLK